MSTQPTKNANEGTMQ